MKIIDYFRNEYFFLSNFYPKKVYYENILYDNNESAFQAQKCQTQEEKLKFMGITPNIAKGKGRSVKIFSLEKWNYEKDKIMHKIVLAKFMQNADLRQKLIDTGDAILIEGNNWRDKYWGVYNGKGQNKLGIITMQVRKEVKECIILGGK